LFDYLLTRNSSKSCQNN